MSHTLWRKQLGVGRAKSEEQLCAATHIRALEKILEAANCPNYPHCDGDGYPVMSGMIGKIITHKEKCEFCHARRELQS